MTDEEIIKLAENTRKGMTTIHIISSSSSANGYILESGGQALVLELGCKTSDYYNILIRKGGLVAGCLASHR